MDFKIQARYSCSSTTTHCHVESHTLALKHFDRSQGESCLVFLSIMPPKNPTIQTPPLPILNNPMMESGNISILKQFTLLLLHMEENTSYVFYLQEDKGEFLWRLNANFACLRIAVAACLQPTANQAEATQAQVWSPKCPTREGSVDAQMTRQW